MFQRTLKRVLKICQINDQYEFHTFHFVIFTLTLNKTGDTKLFTWYATDENCANGSFHLDSGIDVLIHLDDLIFGFEMIYIITENRMCINYLIVLNGFFVIKSII